MSRNITDHTDWREQYSDLDPVNYELIDLIGRGSHSVVLKARLVRSSRIVALKVFCKSKKLTEVGVKEEQWYSKLKHRHILRLYGSFETEDHFVLVLEYCEDSLVGLLNRRRRRGFLGLSPTDVRRIVRQIALALQYMHENGAIHRDIKAGNILLKKSRHVKLADFGLVAMIGECSDLSGTPGYMSPETLISGHGQTPASDAHSLGVLIKVLILGRSADEFESPAHGHHELPAPFDNLVLALTAQDPSQRPSMQDVLNHDAIRDYSMLPNVAELPIYTHKTDEYLFQCADGLATLKTKKTSIVVTGSGNVLVDGVPTEFTSIDWLLQRTMHRLVEAVRETPDLFSLNQTPIISTDRDINPEVSKQVFIPPTPPSLSVPRLKRVVQSPDVGWASCFSFPSLFLYQLNEGLAFQVKGMALTIMALPQDLDNYPELRCLSIGLSLPLTDALDSKSTLLPHWVRVATSELHNLVSQD